MEPQWLAGTAFSLGFDCGNNAFQHEVISPTAVSHMRRPATLIQDTWGTCSGRNSFATGTYTTQSHIQLVTDKLVVGSAFLKKWSMYPEIHLIKQKNRILTAALNN